MKVYLAGPIGGLTYEESVGWREDAAEELRLVGIGSFNPMRFKGFLAGKGVIAPRADNLPESVWTKAKALTARDLGDIRRSDMVLAYMPPMDRERTGTILEIGYAYPKTPCVLVTTDMEFANHPMVSEMVMATVPTIEEGIQIVKEYLLDEEDPANSFDVLNDDLGSYARDSYSDER
ncbi:MAG: hypothetical protein CMB80_05750 [Flammeovirgaceae bacterium]|nr:hypothetical protein [Flammeovirgaceae bacterium]|tara:strand:- start:3502 stop:4032 length:531 start_codon:yes stop_codon:yes gene_type:complete